MKNDIKHNKKLLFLANRDFFNQANGRASVLKGYLEVLSQLDYDVELVLFCKARDVDIYIQTYSCISKVTQYEIHFIDMLKGAFRAIFKDESFNRNIFYSRKQQKKLKNKLNEGFDYIYLDTVRLSKYVDAKMERVLLDFDDLYSKRYFSLSRGDKNIPILGEFAVRIPVLFRKCVERAARLVLLREAKLLEREELDLAHLVDIRLIVSPVEAETLNQKTGLLVQDFPMMIKEVEYQWEAKPLGNQLKLVFVGSPKLQQNYNTLIEASELFSKGLLDNCELYIIGDTQGVKLDAFHKNMNFVGFVENLYQELLEYDLYFSPINTGTGIKTKNVEAGMLGMPIVTTSIGCEGTKLHNYVKVVDNWNTFDITDFINNELALLIEKNPALRDYVKENFTKTALEIKWNRALEQS